MLRASRVGLFSSRYAITSDDGSVLCTWKPMVFLGGGTFALDGRTFEVSRGGWTGRRYRLLDEVGDQLAVADGVGRMGWTLETRGVTHDFERESMLRRDQVLLADGRPVGSVRRTTFLFSDAEADLPGLPLPVQVFVLVSLIAVWDED